MKKMDVESIPEIKAIKEIADKFISNVSKVIVGKEEVIKRVFIALLCKGHILIEDVPGVGKTQLAKAVAKSLGCSFKRIQCTPDLLPSDITGVQYFNQKTSDFEFRPGPVMANIVVVDEINRAMPRTQSCLLESMQEKQVTVDLETFLLPRPFIIIATQNPIEQEGTFPLPEAQLDRFLLRLGLGHPSQEEEGEIIDRYQKKNPLDGLTSIVQADELLEIQKTCSKIYTDISVRNYIIAICRKTREHEDIKLGVSPRATLGLHIASQAMAAVQGRNYIIPDDVKKLAVPVLAHRLMIKTESRLRGRNAKDILEDITSEVPVPVE